eukprot:GILJ01026370.1.p1 GENE.GILJ01026370.1~~GILJ01026370.1.p1  ORF type:complete len:338 (-),score=31.13 GILJ01026370.1:523-1536(-)
MDIFAVADAPTTAAEVFRSIGGSLKMGENCTGETMISSLYHYSNFRSTKLVLILEDFGCIFSWPVSVRKSFLESVRSWCQTDPSPVWSVVCVGSYPSRTCNSSTWRKCHRFDEHESRICLPFNLADVVTVSPLSRDGVKKKFVDFVVERCLQGADTASEVEVVVEECMSSANGLAGVVQLFGTKMQTYLSVSVRTPAPERWKQVQEECSKYMLEAAESCSAMVETKHILSQLNMLSDEGTAMLNLLKQVVFDGRASLPPSDKFLDMRVAMHCLDTGLFNLVNESLSWPVLRFIRCSCRCCFRGSPEWPKILLCFNQTIFTSTGLLPFKRLFLPWIGS